MKRSMVALMAMGLFAGGVNAQEIISAQNKNGSFEAGNKGWGFYASKKEFNSKDCKVVESTEALPAADGNKYMQLTGVIGAKGKGGFQVSSKLKETFTLTAGSQLEMSCKVRIPTKDIVLAKLVVQCYKQGENKPVRTDVAQVKLKKVNEWISVSKTVDIDKALELGQIKYSLQLKSAGKLDGGTNVEAHVDDVRLAIKSTAAPAE